MEEEGPGEQSVPPRGSHGAARQKQEQGDKRVSSGARFTSVKGLPCLGLDHGFFLGRWKAKRALRVTEDRTSGQCCCCHPEKRWQGGY